MKCEAGCMTFTGGERRHHKDCAFYAGSLTEMYASLESEVARLRGLVERAKPYIVRVRDDLAAVNPDYARKENEWLSDLEKAKNE